MTDSQEKKSKVKRAQVGTVRTVSGNKTISVAVERLVRHPVYQKYVRRRSHVAVHYEHNASKVGDKVEIAPCRRMSKSKSWRLLRVVRAAVTEA